MAQYQGPVRPGMDEAYFRQTGVERPLTSTPQIKQNGGWYWNSSTGKSEQYWAPGQGPSSGGSSSSSSSSSSGPDTSYLNDIYNPAIENLNTLRNNAESQYNDSLDSTRKQYDLAQENSQQNYERNVGLLDENKIEVEQSKQGALANAIRSFNSLNQARQSRFGGGSSAGEAVGELAQQEFFRGQADIEKAYVSETRRLAQQKDDLVLQQTQFNNQLVLEKENAEKQLRSDFNNALSAISANKTQLESAKAAARAELINQYRTEQQNIKFAFAERSASIRESIATRLAEVNNDFSMLEQIARNYDAGQFFNVETPYDIASLNNRAQGSAPTYARNPYATTQEDELNPFYQPTGGASRDF